MGCVFSLPEDRRDAAERSVKGLFLISPAEHDKNLDQKDVCLKQFKVYVLHNTFEVHLNCVELMWHS